jgi:predicted neuraminidase
MQTSYLVKAMSRSSLILSLLFAISCKEVKKEVVKEAPKPAVSPLTSDFVFGDDRDFAQAHASTLVRTNDGNFLVAWFGGTHEKHDDVGIWLTKGNAGNFSRPIEVAKIREDAHWNPVLFKEASGDIILYFKVGKTIDNWETWWIRTTDNGATWSAPAELVAGDKGGRGPVRNKPITLADGILLSGSSKETNKVWDAFVDRSTDNGQTWTKSEFLPLDRTAIEGEGIIQPTLWESAPGKVHMLLRSSAGAICRSDSEDGGVTWSAVYKTELPNPNSGIDVVKLPGGTLALAFNNTSGNWGSRSPLSLGISTDNGLTWPTIVDIDKGTEEEEFSYPAIIQYGDTVAVTYTWKRQKIAFKSFLVKN